jgi:hypothetical protein
VVLKGSRVGAALAALKGSRVGTTSVTLGGSAAGASALTTLRGSSARVTGCFPVTHASGSSAVISVPVIVPPETRYFKIKKRNQGKRREGRSKAKATLTRLMYPFSRRIRNTLTPTVSVVATV